MTRRELLAALGTAPAPTARPPQATPVAIARCAGYDADLAGLIGEMFDQLGGLGRLAANKTVTVKLNLTGSPALRFQGRPLGSTHYTHPRTALAFAHLLGRAGARRIRFVESCAGTSGPLEEFLLESGWNLRALKTAAPNVEFENTNSRGRHPGYARLKVPGGGLVFPAYDLHRAYADTDVFVSLAKLKQHETTAVTLTMKNLFGITPASIYGDDAGLQEPNENPTKGRLQVLHEGKRQPSYSAPAELAPHSSRHPGRRVPRITAELASARPLHISFIDGIETIAGGEGPWIKGIRHVQPGVLVLGTNPVSTDAVGTAVMGMDPRASFPACENTMLLGEQLGVGSADLKQIEVRGGALSDFVYRFS